MLDQPDPRQSKSKTAGPALDFQTHLAKLEAAGLGAQVQSWLGEGRPLPLAAEQLRAVLGQDPLQQIAREFGLPADATLKILAEQIPNAVHQAGAGSPL